MTPTPFGNYLLLERLDGGGVSEVLKAKAFGVKGFERLVVVKRVLPSVADDPSFIPILLDETKPSLQLRHPNIAEVFDIGLRDQLFFLAMEYVQGRSLRELLDRRVASRLPVPPDLACFIMMKVAAGLSHAHGRREPDGREAPMIHGGLGPSNVLISRRGDVKIADFGFGRAAARVGKTRTGLFRGKFGYMSPEQVRGMEQDPRSDVFSTGVCLYELLTATRLFEAESDFLTLDNIRSAHVPPPSERVPGLDPTLDAIVLKALTRRPEERYSTADELHQDLQSHLFRERRHVAAEDLADYLEKLFGMEIEREAERDGEFLDVPWPGRETVEVADPSASMRKEAVSGVAGSPSGALPGDAETRNVHNPGASEGSSHPPPLPLQRGSRRKKSGSPGRRSASIGSHSVRSRPLQAPGPGASAPGAGQAVRLGWEEDELATEVYSGAEAEESVSSSGQRGASPASAPQLLSLAGPPSRPVAPPSYASPRLPPPAKLPRRMGSDRAGNPSPFASVENGPAAGRRRGARGPVRPWLLWMLVTVLFMLATTGLVYTFIGKKPGSMVVSTVPRDAMVLFDEKPVSTGASLSPFVIENIDSTRRHLLEVQREGYRDYREMIEVGSGKTHKLPTIELVPLRGGAVSTASGGTGFTLATDPAGARVYVDGRELDQRTPVRIGDLTPGTYQVRVERGQRYVPWETAVTVVSGRIRELPLAQLALRSATIKFRSRPSGAAVTLVRGSERRSIGSTPTNADVEIVGAPWTVEMEREGYAPWTSELHAPLGREEFELVASLVPGDAVPPATNSPAASRNRGTGALRRSDRPRVERAVPSQSSRPRQQNRTRPQQPAPPVVADMAPAQPAGRGNGTLQVNSIPWAQVFVDGRLIGNTPQMNLQLSPGIHAVMLVNPDFSIQKSFAVEIEAGRTTRRVVRLPLGE